MWIGSTCIQAMFCFISLNTLWVSFFFFFFLLTYSKISPLQFVKRMLHKNQFQQITTEQFSTSFFFRCRNRRNSKYCSAKVFTSMTRSASAVFHLFIPDSFLPPRCFSSSCFEFISSSPPFCVCVCARLPLSLCVHHSCSLCEAVECQRYRSSVREL